MTFEVEIKIKLQNSDKKDLLSYLKNIKAKFLGKYTQEDSYFDTVDPSFGRLDKALRVRKQSSDKSQKIELTYKGPKISPNSKSRKELNLVLDKNSDFSTIESLLTELGFINKYTISKIRQSWMLSEDTEISLDSNEFGDFIEIERIIQQKDDVEKIENELWSLLQTIFGKIELNRKLTKSYLELFLESKGII